MRRHRVISSQLPSPGKDVELPDSESAHLAKVLRAKEGTLIEVIDAKGSGVTAEIVRLPHKKNPMLIRYQSAMQIYGEPPVPLTVFSAILKGDAYAWVIEKCVELGVSTFIPLETEYTVVQTKNQSEEKFVTRWQNLADQTLKQCERLVQMKIHTPLSFDSAHVMGRNFHNLVALERSENAQNGFSTSLFDLVLKRRGEIKSAETGRKPVSLWIGPEGGWSPREIKLFHSDSGLFQPISLGANILRAETAVLYSVSLARNLFTL